MKKLSLAMAVIMILAICASTLCMTAFAADSYAETTVAVVTDAAGTTTEYATLAEAFAAYKGGETITLIKDVELTESLTIEGAATTLDADDNEVTTIKDTLTINGNGKTITVTLAAEGYALTIKTADIVINELTLISNNNGIDIQDESDVTLNNCNVYAGGTKAGEHITGDHATKGTAVMQNKHPKAYVEINGGEYKGTGSATTTVTDDTPKTKYSSATVFDVRYGRAVINNATIIGYNSGVLFQAGDAAVPEGGEEALQCAAWINGGTYILYTPAFNATNSVLIRSYRGALLTVFDGTFINYTEGNKVGGSVFGSHSAGGTHTYVLGGEFYNLSSNVASNLMGHNAVKNAVAAMEAAMFFHMYGGNFYSSVVADRVEVNVEGENQVIRNKNDYDLVKKEAQTVKDPYATTDMLQANTYTYNYKYNADAAKAGAPLMVTNPDGKVFYADTLWQAMNALADDGAIITLLDNVTLTRECVLMARDVKLTLDLNGFTITAAEGVKNAICCQMGDITIVGGTLVNAAGTVASAGYSPMDLGDGDFEEVLFNTYDVNITLKDVTVTAASDAVKVNCVENGTLTYNNATVNGTAKNETVDFAEAEIPDVPGGDEPSGDTPSGDTPSGDTPSGDTPSGDTPSGDTPTTDTPAKDDKPADDKKPEEKSGCGSAIGVGAIAILAVAGAACGFAAKKRED